MTILCVDGSHVKRYGALTVKLLECNSFGISRGAVTNPSHLRTILADIEEHRSSYLMHMGGNDLGSRGNGIDNVVIGLTALLTQIRVKFHIPHIHA